LNAFPSSYRPRTGPGLPPRLNSLWQKGTGSEPSGAGAVENDVPRGACPLLPQTVNPQSTIHNPQSLFQRRDTGREFLLTLSLAALCLFGVPGCPPGPRVQPSGPPPPPRELEEIVAVITRNNALLDRPLWSRGVTVSARIKDDNGKEHLYNLEGSLLFQKPLNLRLDLRPGVGDQVMQIGSNADDYWLWIEPELKTMRWGRHRFAGKPCSEPMTVRPDQFAAALGLAELPKPESGLIGPVRRYGKVRDILCYLRPREDGGYVFEREYQVDRTPPYLVRVVLYRDALGRISMDSVLDDYRAVWEGGPLLAHSISMNWREDEGWLKLSLGPLKDTDPAKLSPRAFLRPTAANLPRGIEQVIQVDAACDLPAPSSEPADDPDEPEDAPERPNPGDWPDD